MFELILWSEAEQDIAEAQQWYDDRREGLGDDFEACLDEAFEKLCDTRPCLASFIPAYGDFRFVDSLMASISMSSTRPSWLSPCSTVAKI